MRNLSKGQIKARESAASVARRFMRRNPGASFDSMRREVMKVLHESRHEDYLKQLYRECNLENARRRAERDLAIVRKTIAAYRLKEACNGNVDNSIELCLLLHEKVSR